MQTQDFLARPTSLRPLALALLVLPCTGCALLGYFEKLPPERTGTAAWTDRGPTPLGRQGSRPQGIAYINGRLIWANCRKDTRSQVYEIDPVSMKVLRRFDMPSEAVHTGGLAWDGSVLWAVDYASNRAYSIELEASLRLGRAVLRGSFDTTLRGASACCLVPFRGERLLAISDFMHSARTIFVRPEAALARGTAEGQIVFAYRNEGFSQGLVYAGGFLYEAEGKWGRDVINQLDLGRLARTRDARAATVRQFPAPSAMVEDLAWDGERIWTSDESVYRFFSGFLLTQRGRPAGGP